MSRSVLRQPCRLALRWLGRHLHTLARTAGRPLQQRCRPSSSQGPEPGAQIQARLAAGRASLVCSSMQRLMCGTAARLLHRMEMTRRARMPEWPLSAVTQWHKLIEELYSVLNVAAA
jgi:hypothetical protein